MSSIVTITKVGKYGRVDGRAIQCKVGDQLEVHSWYSTYLVEEGLAEATGIGPVGKPNPTDQIDVKLYKNDAPPVNVTEGALKLAEREGIDLSAVTGTGKDGKITVGDVRTAIHDRLPDNI